MFDSPTKLILGLVTGIAFGFLLQKGQVAKYSVLMGQFYLKEWTVFKIMMTAIAVGSIGIYAMHTSGMIKLEIKPAAFAGVIIGAIFFGVGISIFGLCPGTSVAACGEGRRDAMVGVGGMFAGAFAYVLAYPSMKSLADSMGNWGKVTLPQITHTSPWIWVAGLIFGVVIIYLLLDRHKNVSKTPIIRTA